MTGPHSGPTAPPGTDGAQGAGSRLVAAFRVAYEGLLIALTIAMVAVVVVAVWFRYVMADPILYSFELSTLLFAWIVFAGMALARVDDAHLGVDLLTGVRSPAIRWIVRVLREAIVLGISAYLTWLAYQLTLRTGVQLTSMRISAKWLYAAMPIGFGLMTGLSAIRLAQLLLPTRRVR